MGVNRREHGHGDYLLLDFHEVKMISVGKDSTSKKLPIQMQQKGCHGELKVVFDKLNSWWERSINEFTEIISASNSGCELAEEVSKLQTELSTIKQEKRVLLETVDHLNAEIKGLNGKPIPLQTENRNDQVKQD